MTQALGLADIQATVLRDRPLPYRGAHVFLRTNDPAHTGKSPDAEDHDIGRWGS
jgi:hypothetical protein